MDLILSLQCRWARHRKAVLAVLIALMAIAAVVWLGYETWRLVVQPEYLAGFRVHPGAIDLKQRFVEVNTWFSGLPVYGHILTATYPPASYAMLWPFLGWLSEEAAVWLWLLTTALALALLASLIIKESGADTVHERLFIALIPASMYATGATIGNGQLMVHVLPALLAGLLLLERKDASWPNDLLATLLLLFALVKPNAAAPFFWIVVFVPRRLRPITLVTTAYVLLTILAVSFQETGLLTTLRDWSSQSLGVSEWASVDLSHGNVHSWLAAYGMERWNFPVSMALLLLLGTWTYWHRDADLWVLIGVAGIVARLWTYHGWYDDLLILPAMISLFRSVKKDHDLLAFGLLGITLAVMTAPGMQYLLPPPYKDVGLGFQVLVWFALLAFLLHRAWRDKKATDRRLLQVKPR